MIKVFKSLVVLSLVLSLTIMIGTFGFALSDVDKLNIAIENRSTAYIENVSLNDARNLCRQLNVYNKFTTKDGLWLNWKNNNAYISAIDYWNTKIQDTQVDKFVNNWVRYNYTEDQRDMVLRIKNYILNTVDYDVENTYYYRYSAFGAYQGLAVCQGYTLYAQKFFNQAGIENKLVLDKPNNHSYNMICVDGKWYIVDLTKEWNMLQTQDSKDLLRVMDRLFWLGG